MTFTGDRPFAPTDYAPADYAPTDYSGTDHSGDEAALAAAATELDEVEAALERLEDGTFERCQVCGGPIGRERLMQHPLSTRCAQHVPSGSLERPVPVLAVDQPLPFGGEHP